MPLPRASWLTATRRGPVAGECYGTRTRRALFLHAMPQRPLLWPQTLTSPQIRRAVSGILASHC